jgi:hypothetical protein
VLVIASEASRGGMVEGRYGGFGYVVAVNGGWMDWNYPVPLPKLKLAHGRCSEQVFGRLKAYNTSIYLHSVILDLANLPMCIFHICDRMGRAHHTISIMPIYSNSSHIHILTQPSHITQPLSLNFQSFYATIQVCYPPSVSHPLQITPSYPLTSGGLPTG